MMAQSTISQSGSMNTEDAATAVDNDDYLEKCIAVCIGNMRLQTGKVCLVVVSEVKVFHAKLRVLDLHLLIAFGNHGNGIILCSATATTVSPFTTTIITSI